jgi:hypothetical protein
MSHSHIQHASASYQRLWELFVQFCRFAHRCSLPASPDTVCAYLGSLFEGGCLRGSYIRPYIAAIVAQHRPLALSDPTSHSLVVLARRGFAAADALRRTGALLRSAAYPAAAALSCLGSALRSGSSADLRCCGVVCLGFLLSARPASVLALTSDAVRLAPDAVNTELRVFKYGTSGFAPRVALRIPTADDSDPIRCLFRRLLAAFQGRPHAQLVLQRDLRGATAAGLCAVGAIAPPGTQYTPRSLDSGGITAAYAAGVPLERIMRVSNHVSTAVVLRHYLDPLVVPTPAATSFLWPVPARCACPFRAGCAGLVLCWQSSLVPPRPPLLPRYIHCRLAGLPLFLKVISTMLSNKQGTKLSRNTP